MLVFIIIHFIQDYNEDNPLRAIFTVIMSCTILEGNNSSHEKYMKMFKIDVNEI